MSHDFAKKDNKKRPSKTKAKNTRNTAEKKGLPGWFLFLAGIACTLFAQFIIHLAQIDTDKLGSEISQAAKEQAAKAAENIEQATEKAPKPKVPEFTFYDELKTQEVPVDVKEVEQREQEDYNYALQAGSFRQQDDAEQQRAEIILLGLDAAIEKKTTSAGSVRYRVIVGPFTSRSKLHSARNTLIGNNIETLTIKRG
jgi:cell division protein FtsN